MGWIEVVTAIVQSYKEREAAKQDNEKVEIIINAIYDAAQQVTNEIKEKLEKMRLERLYGTFMGLFLNFKEYEPNEAHREWLERILFDGNLIIGELRLILDKESEPEKKWEVFDLLTIVSLLRSTVMSELKYTFQINKDKDIREMLTYLVSVNDHLISIYTNIETTNGNTYRNCYNIARAPSTRPWGTLNICFAVDPPELPEIGDDSDCACSAERVAFKRSIKAVTDLVKIKEAIIVAIDSIGH